MADSHITDSFNLKLGHAYLTYQKGKLCTIVARHWMM
jgi:hypothetical protein